jgi:hypothetical protein
LNISDYRSWNDERAYFLHSGTGTPILTVIFCQNSGFTIVLLEGRGQKAKGREMNTVDLSQENLTFVFNFLKTSIFDAV